MQAYYRDEESNVCLYKDDCRMVLKELEPESVQCVVTSPPYWGLRDYKLLPAVWGGEEQCDHEWGDVGSCHHPGHVEQTKWKKAEAAGKGQTAGSGQFCQKCSAWYGTLGLEATPELYVQHMVDVFKLIWTVLRKDGTVWLNLGDSYAGYRGNKNHTIPSSSTNGWTNGTNENLRGSALGTLKPKDLIGIPWRVAFALQADGWWLRQDLVWHKPNTLPESVRDRCTKSHEYIFLLTKNVRYYYDSDSIREQSVDMEASFNRYKSSFGGNKNNYLLATNQVHTRPIGKREFDGKRNKRSVWTITTKPFKDAHFAVFPEKLVEPCVLAGSGEGDIVLDPFAGSGTVLCVSKKLKRKSIGIEMSTNYCDIAVKRINKSEVNLF